MALSNSQYNELMRIYEQRQLDAVHQVQERYERVTQAIPEFAEIVTPSLLPVSGRRDFC